MSLGGETPTMKFERLLVEGTMRVPGGLDPDSAGVTSTEENAVQPASVNYNVGAVGGTARVTGTRVRVGNALMFISEYEKLVVDGEIEKRKQHEQILFLKLWAALIFFIPKICLFFDSTNYPITSSLAARLYKISTLLWTVFLGVVLNSKFTTRTALLIVGAFVLLGSVKIHMTFPAHYVYGGWEGLRVYVGVRVWDVGALVYFLKVAAEYVVRYLKGLYRGRV